MVWNIVIYIAVMLLTELLRPKPKFEDAKPADLGDFRVATATEGRAVPLLWGTCMIDGPNVVWYGDLKAVPIKEKIKTGLFSSSTVTIGFKYYLGLHLAICRGPINGISRVVYDRDKLLYDNAGVPVTGTITIDDEEILGGEDKAGGIQMDLVIRTGAIDDSEGLNSYLVAKLPSGDVPAYQGTAQLIFKGMGAVNEGAYIGNSPNLAQYEFTVHRWPNGLAMTGNKHIVNTLDSNPMCVLYEVMTDPYWGAGLQSNLIDVVGFRTAGDTLFTEGNGFSLVLDSFQDIGETIREIERQTNGKLYQDVATGQWKFVLVRADYDINTVTQLNESNVVDVKDFGRPAWSETQNEVRIEYSDPTKNYNTTFALAQDPANLDTQQSRKIARVRFPGVKNATLANKLAWRMMRVQGYPIAKAKIVVNRIAWDAYPTKVFALTWPRLGLVKFPFRLKSVTLGTVDDGTITMEVIQDVYQTEPAVYSNPPPSGWVEPTLAPIPVVNQLLLEVPYYVVANTLTAGEISLLTNRAVVLVLVEDPANNTAYKVYRATADVTAQYQYMAEGVYTYTALLNGAITWNGTSILFDNPKGTIGELGVGSFARIDNEWFDITAVDFVAGTATIVRGILDTIPTAHNDNAKIWFYGGVNGFAGLDFPLTVGQQQFFRETGLGSTGIQTDLATAPTANRIMIADYLRPYPPADVQLEGLYFPTDISGTFVITWKGRSRLLLTKTAWTGAHQTPESGVSYTMRVYNNDTATLLATYTQLATSISGGTFTFPGHTTMVVNYRVELESVKSGTSVQKFSHVAAAYGYGMKYDDRYGGTILGVVLPRATSAAAGGEQYAPVPSAKYLNGYWRDLDNKSSKISYDNGTSWTTQSDGVLGLGETYYRQEKYIYGGGYYIAFSSAGSIYYYRREDTNWKYVSLPSGDGRQSAIYWDGTRFVALFPGAQRIRVTADPSLTANWTVIGGNPNTLFSTHFVWKIVSFVKAGANYVAMTQGTNGTYMYHSTDLITWTQGNAIPLSFIYNSGVHYFGGAWLLITRNNPEVAPNANVGILEIWRSTDFLTWTKQTVDDVTVGEQPEYYGTFVMSGKIHVIGGNSVFHSTNGTTWSRLAADKAWTPTREFQTKADPLSTEGGPSTIFVSVPYFAEDGGKISEITGLEDKTPTLVYPPVAVFNTQWWGNLFPYGFNGGQPQLKFDQSGFRGSLNVMGFYATGNAPRRTGQRYWEAYIDSLPYGSTTIAIEVLIGISAPGLVLTDGVAYAAVGFNEQVRYQPAAGDVVGVLCDLDIGTVEFKVNNVSFKIVNGLPTETMYTPIFDTPRTVARHNLGQSAFVYSQAGYVTWFS